MKLLDLYKSILATANMTTTADGFISMQLGDASKPATLKGKRLVLPSPEHLANPNWKDRVAFHPMSENILRGESDVLGFFRQALNIRLNYTFGALAYELLTIATSPGMHAKLTPDQSEFLSRVKNADEKTLAVLLKLMDAMPANQTQKQFVSIYLKRAGMVGGKRYSRVGVVSFPLYQDLKKSTTEVYGVKMRVKDRESLMALLEYMVPDIGEAEQHMRGSDSPVAPYLDALMKSVLVVASPLNDLIELFKNQLDKPETLAFADEWVETFENLGVMVNEVRSVPMLAGNEGTTAKGDSTAQPIDVAPAPVQAAQPAFAPAPAPVAPAPAPFYPGQPAAGYVAPGGHPGYPYQPQPGHFVPAPPPGPVKTERGLDFESVLRSNPALAQQVGGVGGGGFYQPQHQQPQGPRQPRWAAPTASFGTLGQGSGGYMVNGQPQWGGGTVGSQWGGNQGGGFGRL